jgi:hypothetical protein
MPTLYESHGLTVTETAGGNADNPSAFIPARIYAIGLPATPTDRDDITVHTDSKRVTRKPSISSESEIITFLVDFDPNYESFVDRQSDVDITIPDSAGSSGSWTGTIVVANVEVDGEFTAGDGSAKRMTINCEVVA